jgi:hypothetical protein
MIKTVYMEVPRMIEAEILYCDHCDVPMEVDTSKVLLSYPPRYEYRCPKCKAIVMKSELFSGNKELDRLRLREKYQEV